MKNRSIADNVILTEELVHNIKKPNTNGNVIFKLDMTKVFYRVSWNYLCHVMRHLGFYEFWINMVFRLISNKWYSININSIRHGFFKSSRGLKQGDPLSPSLFIIGAELLSRMLDHLPMDNFIPFCIDTGSPIITHLSYTDDTILFSSV